MQTKVWLVKITCPECGTVRFGFVGDDEDGEFYCNEKIKIIKGKKESTEVCGFYMEKLYYMPEGSCEFLYSITFENGKGIKIDVKEVEKAKEQHEKRI